MADKDAKPQTGRQDSRSARQARLAAELRSNLRKRKAHASNRRQEQETSTPPKVEEET
jgi:hypothetical protein